MVTNAELRGQLRLAAVTRISAENTAGRLAETLADLADLQAILRASIQGQEQLTLFALGRTRR
jgi:hypothetical protein